MDFLSHNRPFQRNEATHGYTILKDLDYLRFAIGEGWIRVRFRNQGKPLFSANFWITNHYLQHSPFRRMLSLDGSPRPFSNGPTFATHLLRQHLREVMYPKPSSYLALPVQSNVHCSIPGSLEPIDLRF